MKINRVLFFIFLALSIIGFLDATYLSAKHFLGTVPPCFITTGCEKVLTSKYNQILGIPVALLGAINYLVLIIASIVYMDTKKEKIIRFGANYTIVGLVFSIYFVILMLFIIKAICFYCMISAIVSTLLFAFSFPLKKSLFHN